MRSLVKLAMRGLQPVLIVTLSLTSLPSRAAQAAENCLATPNTVTPQGKHWYYRLEHGSQKCWYLGLAGKAVRQPASQSASVAPVTASQPQIGADIVRRVQTPAPQQTVAQGNAGDDALPALNQEPTSDIKDTQAAESGAPATMPWPQAGSDNAAGASDASMQAMPSGSAEAEAAPSHSSNSEDAVRDSGMSGADVGQPAGPPARAVKFSAIALAFAAAFLISLLLLRMIAKKLVARGVFVDPGRIERGASDGRWPPSRETPRLPYVTGPLRRRPVEDHEEISQLWQVLRALERGAANRSGPIQVGPSRRLRRP